MLYQNTFAFFIKTHFSAMKKLCLFLLFISGSSFITFAQSDTSQAPERVYINSPGSYMITVEAGSGLEVPASKIEGSPYLWDKNKTGQLFIEGNKVVRNFTFNYNVWRDQIEFADAGKNRVISKPGAIKKIAYNEEQALHYVPYEKKRFLLKNQVDTTFMELLVDGKVSLFKNPQCKLKDPDYNEALMVGDKNYKFVHGQSYYIQKDAKLLKKIKPKERRLFQLLTKKQDKVKNYIENNNLNLENEKDLARVFRYYNDLL